MAFEFIEARRLRNQLAIVEMKQAIATIEAVTSPNAAGIKALQDPDEENWKELGKAEDGRALDDSDQATQRQQAIKFFYRNPHCRNIIRIIVKYVVGRGFAIDPESPVPHVREWWDKFWKVNKLALKKREIVRRVIRDGECFIRFFLSKGNVIFRFMDPDLVNEPDDPKVKRYIKGNPSHGIETSKDDIEEVLAYWYNGKRIPADEVYHIKSLVDSDVKRGRSYIEVIMPYIEMYNRWLRDRMKLNMVRAVVGLVRTVTGSPAQAANLADAYKTNTIKNPNKTQKAQMPEGVSIFTTNKGVEYDLKSPNLQASDVQYDGRAILLAIAAGAGLPEFMVTSDSSNGNYASTMVAEGPAVMEIEDWQDFFGFHFEQIFTKVTETGIRLGEIPQKAIIDEEQESTDKDGNRVTKSVKVLREVSTEAMVTFPDVAVNDILKETQAMVLQNNQGLISKRKASTRLGNDYDEVVKQIAEEEAELDAQDSEEDDINLLDPDKNKTAEEEEGEGDERQTSAVEK